MKLFMTAILGAATLPSVLSYLECQKVSEVLGNSCALQTNSSCQNYKGDGCRKELSEKRHSLFAAPQLSFQNDSLVYDPANQLLCVKGLQIPSGNRIDGSEIQGVYFELNATLEHSRAYRKNYSSQNTVIFPGTATNETLKKGLFCSEITLSESEILDDRVYFILGIITLPPPLYGTYDFQWHPRVRAKEVPRRSITLHSCLGWNEKEVSTTPKNSCAIEISGDTKTRSDEPKERSLEFWRCGFACLVFLTGQIAGHATSHFTSKYGLKRKLEKPSTQRDGIPLKGVSGRNTSSRRCLVTTSDNDVISVAQSEGDLLETVPMCSMLDDL